MRNEYTLSAYVEQLKKLLDATHYSVAAEVTEHLWLDHFIAAEYPDPFYVEADIAIAEMINGSPTLASSGEMPEFSAKINVPIDHYYDPSLLNKRQREIFFPACKRAAEMFKEDPFEQDMHQCILHEVFQLFGKYSKFFGKTVS